MYIESPQGSELGFPQHYMRRGWREHVDAGSGGPGAGMMLQPGVGPVTAMGPGPGMRHMHHRRPHHGGWHGFGADAPPAAAAPAPAPVVQMHPADTGHSHMPLIVGGALVLGLAFVIYKATR